TRGAATVVDADGLNALARTEDWPKLLPQRCVLTPHDGEAARLAGGVVPAGSGRIAFAERHAREWQATVVLKGPVTVVTDGKKTFVHDLPNPTLGVGGSGDVLGGAVAAFLARGLAPLAAARARAIPSSCSWGRRSRPNATPPWRSACRSRSGTQKARARWPRRRARPGPRPRCTSKWIPGSPGWARRSPRRPIATGRSRRSRARGPTACSLTPRDPTRAILRRPS